MSMECLFIFLCCLEFLSSVFYSFQSIDLSPLWLGLFLGILLFLIQLWIIFLISLSAASLLAYKNTINYCRLILYPMISLNLWNNSSSFFGGVFWVFYIEYLQIVKIWGLPWQYGCLLFLFAVCLLWLGLLILF